MVKLHRQILKIWETKQQSEEWRTIVVCPAHKKSDNFLCKNSKGISLLNTTYEVVATIIRNKLEKNAENIIGEYQASFKQERSSGPTFYSEASLQLGY